MAPSSEDMCGVLDLDESLGDAEVLALPPSSCLVDSLGGTSLISSLFPTGGL